MTQTVTETGEQVHHFRIEGMSCAGCVARVQQALLSTPGVSQAEVNLPTERARVRAARGTSFEQIASRVRECGYDALPLRRAQRRSDVADEQTYRENQRVHRQALTTALMYGIPVIALEFLGSTLSSSLPGSHVWWRTLQGALCTLALFSPAGGPLIYSGIRALWFRTPNMDLLITLGVLAAYLSSVISIAIPQATHFHFHAVVMILAFIDAGRLIEAKARRGLSDSVSALLRRMPRTALRVVQDDLEEVSVDEVQQGDQLCVPSDTQVPVDGLIVSGRAAVDEAMLTGESVPVDKDAGDRVYGGTIVKDGLLTIEATSLGENSAVGQIIQAVQKAQSSQTHIQRIADRVAAVFVPVVVGLGLITLIGWGLLASSWSGGLASMIAVLVIACPCAMGLAAPTAVYIATARAALKGVLVKNAAALERLGQVDVMVFDKTGTLTSGSPVVTELLTPESGGEEELLRLAASLEQLSSHPLARAIVEKARQRNLRLAQPEEFRQQPGLGVSGRLGDVVVHVGSRQLLEHNQIDTQPLGEFFRKLASGGHSVVWIAGGGRVTGLIGLIDEPREGAAQTVGTVHALGIKSLMVTGDHPESAEYVAGVVGIDRVRARTTPQQKAEIVEALQQEDQVVAFVGDGINDAPAMTRADVGMTFATGTDVANQAAGITLVGSDLQLIPLAINIGRRSVAIIRQNLGWALIYNVLAIPLAAFGIIPAWVAPAAMMFSSIAVVTNSLRLRAESNKITI